jgi:SDR family mycofactocin-dependent oxidoreductase
MGRVEGKVAFITGAARGQGRSHALRLAQEGADIIAVDIDQQVETSMSPTATAADLDTTVRMVEELDRRIYARTADVRDLPALQRVVADGVAEFGRLDIVCANAGIGSAGVLWELDEHVFQEMIDINLTGVWKTIKATMPVLVEQGTGGSVILTSSVAGVSALANLGHYVAAKHGVTGLMRSLAVEGAPHGIRCNSVHPTTVDTPIIDNPAGYELFTGVKGATRADVEAALLQLNALRVSFVEAVDISNMVLFLASDEARYVTGTTQLVDAGINLPFKIPPR